MMDATSQPPVSDRIPPQLAVEPYYPASTAESNELARDVRYLFTREPGETDLGTSHVGRYAVLAFFVMVIAIAGWRRQEVRKLSDYAASMLAHRAEPDASLAMASTSPPKLPAPPSTTVSAEETAPRQDQIPVEQNASLDSPKDRSSEKKLVGVSSRTRIRSTAAGTDISEISENEGEKYLYGDGVPVDCSRAQKDLLTAAKHSNAKAESELGSMYATGHCVIRDLPLAYRWFARAQQRNSHGNRKIAQDMRALWNQMSPEEKQLATR
jgi:TPR repeat protein